jgi:hypothetical protein
VRPRRIASAVLIALASVCLTLALVAGYVRTTVLDSDQFADRATAALARPAVRDVVARQITDQAVLRANQDLVAVRPLVETAAGAIVSTTAFQSLFRSAVRDLHRTVFTDDRDTATVTVANVGILLSGALERLDPQIAARIPASFSARLDSGDTALDALDAADTVDLAERLAWILGIAAALMLVAGVAVAPVRRRATVHAGIGVAVAGALVVVAYQIARSQLVARFGLPDEQAAAGAVWDSFAQDLRTWALVTLGCGTVVAAASASLLRPVDVRGPLARAWALVTTVPISPARRAVRAVALVVAGVLIITQRRWMLDVGLVLVGVYVLYQGVEELLRLIARPAPARDEPEPQRRDDPAAAAPRFRPRPARERARPWLAGGVAAALVVAMIALLFGSGGTEATARAAITTCNGRAELCDRPLNDVVFAGTHNAMSAPTYPGYLFAQQEKGLTGQLDDGVRALLIDTHWGRKVNGRVLTDLEGRQEKQAAIDEIGRSATEAALRIRTTLLGRRGGGAAGERSLWLCHGFCEVGAVPLASGLREIADFMVAHPDEVIILVIQDEGQTAPELARAIDASGLGAFAYRGRAAAPWPTLREMIEANERLVVLAENTPHDPAVPWIHNAFDVMQETPYHFTDAAQFSCAPNRGASTNSLFLLNHWIDTTPAPRPSNAAKVNAYDVLLGRARTCQKERGLQPNVLAVDFYRTGDLMKVVDTLNRIPQQP